MKVSLLSGIVTVGLVLGGCSTASFVGNSGKRSANGDNPSVPGNPDGQTPGSNDPDDKDPPLNNKEKDPVDPTKGNPNGPQPGGPDQILEKTFALTCEDTIQVVEFDAEANTRVDAKVSGAFCPQASNKLNVVFVVDYSASMGKHVDTETRVEEDGNDPQIDGSCGRLEAAQAILKKLIAEKSAGDQIQLAMVPFAGATLADRVIPLTDLDAFEASVNKDTFCQYVTQNSYYGYDPVNPGGIDGGAINSSTNYKAAFDSTRSMLAGETGQNVIYFISDGEPTSGGANPVKAGRNAGKDLRDAVDNITLNGLLLGGDRGQARGVLEQVTGSSDRVRIAADASQLADEILEFPAPEIRSATGSASISVEPHGESDLGLQSLARDNSEQAQWNYLTQPFVLVGTPGEVTEHIVNVSALGQDGSKHRQTIKIRYKMN